MTHIPRVRTCSTLRRALAASRIPPSLDFYRPRAQRAREASSSWSRIFEDTLCRTVTTAMTPQCTFTGQWMHWEEHRLLTVMEVKRVQSFPDREVLLGNPAKAFRIVGNSVDRRVALAWGLAIREAWWGRGGGVDGKGWGTGAGGVGEGGAWWGREFEKRLGEYRHVKLAPAQRTDPDSEAEAEEKSEAEAVIQQQLQPFLSSNTHTTHTTTTTTTHSNTTTNNTTPPTAPSAPKTTTTNTTTNTTATSSIAFTLKRPTPPLPPGGRPSLFRPTPVSIVMLSSDSEPEPEAPEVDADAERWSAGGARGSRRSSRRRSSARRRSGSTAGGAWGSGAEPEPEIVAELAGGGGGDVAAAAAVMGDAVMLDA